MAPVPFQHPLRYAPLAVVGTHLVSVIYLTYAITVSLYTSYKSIGPAQDTRSRLAQRKKLVPAFLGLAVAALCLATYTSTTSAVLSYQTWASEHGLDKPEKFIPEDEVLLSQNSSKINLAYVAQWLSDTPVYSDILEIVTEKARRFWWGQQIDLATVAFSTLLSIEGRRRNVLLTAAFLTLAHLVNLSYAQNLFYLALLLTPSPLPSGNNGLESAAMPFPIPQLVRIGNRVFPPKPTNWHLHSSIFISTLVLNFGSIFTLPYVAGTQSFVNVLLLTRASTFLPLILPRIAPMSWGTVHYRPHNSYYSFTVIFRTISFVSFVLHMKSSIMGLTYNIPNSHYHRHSAILPWDVEERTAFERGTTAFGKVLGSIMDHPAVEAVGWDVLICTLSIGLWAGVRAIDVQDIIESSIPIYASRHKPQELVEDEATKTPIKIEPEPEESVSEHSMTLRRRGRPAKPRFGSVASSSGFSEDNMVTSGRRRGRPKKKQPEGEKAYKPTPSVVRELVEGDTLPANELDWESSTLTWGLVALTGLGSACAGVFGGECTSR
ncbi:uncharacterized protein GGS25DRAFT_106215 [Hypoxylon fragiforme]|uniref:uncharacterized protein n=1 Tax=Hypoxylon fragiforme TaxID=63214 RepID=UPI0020C63DA9|nr:uncharacterized protein GGS25DRAFT_106215 [Hypoxylon fragiforme]KAI2612106.1 hypothetical protein GGS25DRAFT_106215 [Hypoxylon fragiforme]